MAKFCRHINERDLKALEAIANQHDFDHWWKDLLTLWQPSGQPSGSDGLRLGIRCGYMNFYRRGQSIGRVSFNRQHEPVLTVHAKYVVPKHERALVVGQEYVTLLDKTLVRKYGLPPIAYLGTSSILQWIKAVDEDYTGEEKRLVDDLLGIQANDGVIDLEMGLPAWGTKQTAPRMDIVSINQIKGQPTVFFGEVKRATDGRLRCNAPLKCDEKPEVLRQLSEYRKYLAEHCHQELVGAQYAKSARLLIRIRQMADSLGPARPLGQSILDAAKLGHLAVAKLATLIVIHDGLATPKNWKLHRLKLEAESERVPLIELCAPAELVFGASL